MKIRLSPPQIIFEIGKRQNQEDFIYASDPGKGGRLFILCDGMGGHEKGEVASRIIAEETANFLNHHLPEDGLLSDELFEKAFEYACQHLDQQDNDNGGVRKMGTTFTCLCFHKGGCLAAHVGDSRIYHIRQRRMLYKSKDHSLVVELYQSGEISFSEMSTSSQKNVITRAVMPGKDNRVKTDIVHINDIQPGDYFYLCSDGMMEQMGDDELIDIIARDITDEEKKRLLIAAAAENRDNHSAILLKVDDVEREQGDNNFLGDASVSPFNALLMRRDDDDEETVTMISPEINRQVKQEADDATAVMKSARADKLGKRVTRPTVKADDGGKFKSWMVTVITAIIAAALAVVLFYIL